MRTLTIVPAYGRDYFTRLEATDDWKAGKDFKVRSGPYLSIRDSSALIRDGFTHVCVRYNRLSKSVDLELKA
jgi:hypothetical protein